MMNIETLKQLVKDPQKLNKWFHQKFHSLNETTISCIFGNYISIYNLCDDLTDSLTKCMTSSDNFLDKDKLVNHPFIQAYLNHQIDFVSPALLFDRESCILISLNLSNFPLVKFSKSFAKYVRSLQSQYKILFTNQLHWRSITKDKHVYNKITAIELIYDESQIDVKTITNFLFHKVADQKYIISAIDVNDKIISYASRLIDTCEKLIEFVDIDNPA